MFRSRDDLPSEPFGLFDRWLEEARAEERIRYAGAACLSTIGEDGAPDARWIIVHELGDSGFLIGTDTRSSKAAQIRQDARAALTFYWEPLDRQVRIRGVLHEADREGSDRTFRDRPRQSRWVAWASVQSRPLTSREDLERRVREAEERFEDVDPVPRPSSWKGFRLVASEIEFWQAATGRLHHRARFVRRGTAWERQLLEP